MKPFLLANIGNVKDSSGRRKMYKKDFSKISFIEASPDGLSAEGKRRRHIICYGNLHSGSVSILKLFHCLVFSAKLKLILRHEPANVRHISILLSSTKSRWLCLFIHKHARGSQLKTALVTGNIAATQKSRWRQRQIELGPIVKSYNALITAERFND